MYPVLGVFDNFTGQMTENIMKLLEENNVYVVTVIANCTDRLQPVDISVNKPAKNFLRQQFQEWYAIKICEQLSDKEEMAPVDIVIGSIPFAIAVA